MTSELITSPALYRGFDESLPDLSGQSVLVTGGTGSFGRKFIDDICLRCSPRRVIVYSRDEMKHYEMQRELGVTLEDEPLRFYLGDVRDFDRLSLAMQGVDIVIHAAALKHVPIAEYNPMECLNTNVHGAENVVRAAIQNRVGKVIALSTDKAASPINIYGASKLASDKIFIAANNLSGYAGTKFSVVRYGNVVGSRGSVIPLFRRLIASGARSLPITDPRMTRFWITLDQGVCFVLSCLEAMRGGELFVPKIPSMKLVDLARALAPDLPQEIVGIRPGEKLHEAMITVDDARSTLELEDRFVIEPVFAFWSHESYLKRGAKRVPEGFQFTSDNNREWLDAKSLRRLIGAAEWPGELAS